MGWKLNLNKCSSHFRISQELGKLCLKKGCSSKISNNKRYFGPSKPDEMIEKFVTSTSMSKTLEVSVKILALMKCNVWSEMCFVKTECITSYRQWNLISLISTDCNTLRFTCFFSNTHWNICRSSKKQR